MPAAGGLSAATVTSSNTAAVENPTVAVADASALVVWVHPLMAKRKISPRRLQLILHSFP